MLLLGIDTGTSSVKVCVVDSYSQHVIVSAQYPNEESPSLSPHPGWAEQSPDMWWQQVQYAIRCGARGRNWLGYFYIGQRCFQ